MAAPPSPVPPSTGQKLIAEAPGTALLVCAGAGSAAATGVISAGSKVPFSMAQPGIISFAFMLVIVGAVYAIGHISGNYITSLEMQGFSVTVCALTPELTRLRDAPVDTPALRWGR